MSGKSVPTSNSISRDGGTTGVTVGTGGHSIGTVGNSIGTGGNSIWTAITVVGLVMGLAVTWQQIRMNEEPIDMAIYLEGVRTFLQGGEVYSQPMQVGTVLLPFIYPPFGALVMVPLAHLSVKLAGDIMIAVSSLLLLACLHFVTRAMMGSPDPTVTAVPERACHALVAIVWPAAMLLEPVVLNSSFAQINIIIMGLVVLDLVPRRRFLPQGWLIGIAVAIKLTPLVMLYYFLLKKDIKAIAVSAGSAIAATALAAVVRWDVTVEYFSTTLLGLGGGKNMGVNTAYQSNSSLKGMIMRWFTSEDALNAHTGLVNIVWLVASFIAIGLAGWLMVWLLRRGFDTDAWLVNSILMLLISPISWSHHWVWVALIVPVFAWRWFTSSPRSAWFGGTLALWTVLMVTRPPKWWFGDAIDIYALPWWKTFLVSDYVWLAIALLALYPLICKRLSSPAPVSAR
ncbi:glycosyltransferase family 87 protein [Corynebacterium pyruviciproducens]